MKFSVIGAGVSGKSLAMLAKSMNYDVFVSEKGKISDETRSLFSENGIEFEESGNTEKVFDSDGILISSGIPPQSEILLEAEKRNAKLIGELDFVLPSIKTQNLICVTGTNGKSTVTSLIGHILSKSGLKVAAGGNLGTASAEFAKENFDAVVLELSSFQLERAEKNLGSKVSIITNLAPDHIDWHGSYENYIAAKSKILSLRSSDGVGIIQERDYELLKPSGKIITLSWKNESEIKTYGKILMTEDKALLTLDGKTETLFNYSDTDLIGNHNLENVAMSLCAVKLSGIENCGKAQELISGFKPLPHRCEKAGIVKGVLYVDDSKGTNVAASITAMKSIKGRKIIILGGKGKGEEYNELAETVKSECEYAVLIGEEAEKIQQALISSGFMNFTRVKTMEDAVKISSEKAESGMIVLLSPACTSWDMYKSYKARGEHFCSIVKAMM